MTTHTQLRERGAKNTNLLVLLFISYEKYKKKDNDWREEYQNSVDASKIFKITTTTIKDKNWAFNNISLPFV